MPNTHSTPNGLSSDEWWRLNVALAHYDFCIATEHQSVSAFAYLVCQAMVSAPLQSMTASQICDLLKTEFGAHWVLGEVNAALGELKKAKFVTMLPDPGDQRFYVNEPYRTECIREQNETENLRNRVLEEWAAELKQEHPSLSDEERQLIIQDLIQFCIDIFDRRGAECVALIYSSELRKAEFIKLLETEDVPSLPPRPDNLALIRDAEVLKFFRNSTGERSQYIGHFLQSAFLKHAITIDPKFSGVLSKQFEGSTIVLDTNFLFNLFGLEGQFAESVARATVQFTKELGIKILVHRVSIREFRRSLGSHKKLLETFPMPSQELASAMAESVISNSPLGAYYKRYAATGISWEDWVQPFLAIEARLAEFNIEVTNMYQDEIEADKRFAEEANRIYETSHDYYERIWERPLTMEVCEHDAFLSLFIRKLRDGKPEEFVQAKSWCITYDRKLPRYEQIERHRLGNIPIFILVEHWINFTRPIIPRTEDWDALARSLLLRPFLRAPLRGSIEKIHRAASRIAEYRNYTPQLACMVLLNSRLQEAVRTMSEAEFEEKVTEVVEEALLDEFYKNQGQLELVQNEKTQLQEQSAEHDKVDSSLRVGLNEVKSELENQRALTRRILAIGICAFLVLIGISLNWSALKPLPFSVAVIGMIAGILTIVGTIRSWKVAWNIFLGISAFATLLGVILSLRLGI